MIIYDYLWCFAKWSFWDFHYEMAITDDVFIDYQLYDIWLNHGYFWFDFIFDLRSVSWYVLW